MLGSVLLCCVAVFGVNGDEKLGQVFESGLKVDVLIENENCEQVTKSGDFVKVHYVGTLEDGTVFDSSYNRNSPFTFELGANKVIAGWDEGLQGMCVGEKRKLTVPPELGYGKGGFKSVIPANAVLIFEVELLSIDESKAADETFLEIDADKDGMLSQDEVSAYIKKEEAESGLEERTSDSDHNNLVADIFRNEDVDKDGFISSEEFFRNRHEEL